MSDHPIRDPETDPKPEILTAEEATGAQRGTGMSKMLAVSLVLIVVAFAVIYFVFAPGLSTNKGAGGQSGIISHDQANSFNAPEPAPKPAPVNGVAGAADQPTPH